MGLLGDPAGADSTGFWINGNLTGSINQITNDDRLIIRTDGLRGIRWINDFLGHFLLLDSVFLKFIYDCIHSTRRMAPGHNGRKELNSLSYIVPLRHRTNNSFDIRYLYIPDHRSPAGR